MAKEKHVYEVSIQVLPVPRRRTGVLSTTIVLTKTSTKNVEKYAQELSDLIQHEVLSPPLEE